MQEDKTSNWLADRLRKQQEENPLPYELGAWEAFEKKRIAGFRQKQIYWMSGIAASLAILLVAGGMWLAGDSSLKGSNSLSEETTFEEKNFDPFSQKEEKPIAIEEKSRPGNIPVLGLSEKIDSENLTLKSAFNSPNSASAKPIENKNSTESKLKSDENLVEIDREVVQENISMSVPLFPQKVAEEKKDKEITKPEVSEQVIASVELPKEPQLSEEEIMEILDAKSFATIVMGLTSGFGGSQGTEQTTSGASLGLGVMVDMKLTDKLVVGSGIGLNYLNQASESQNYTQVAGFAAPVTEKNEISQVQVDIPFYFKYPITLSRSISIQAGFSNLVTFNQNAEQQSSYTRQVAVLDSNAAGSNSFTLKSESVNQSSVLEVPQNRFYPFATANLGVNIRLFESKKSSYEVMPFYNYPLQEFSGYGEKIGMFGASFKVNFGATQKK